MPPQQSVPNPYDFITQGPVKTKGSRLPTAKTPKQKGLLAAAFLGILVFFGIIFFLLFSSGGADMQPMVRLAQTQNEIIRISGAASRDIRSADVADFNQNTYITTISGQQQTIAYIAKHQKAPAAKDLALTQSSATDTKLKDATAAGTYDQALQGVLYTQLKAYQAQLAETYKNASGVQQRELLQNLYNNVSTLLKNQTPPTSS